MNYFGYALVLSLFASVPLVCTDPVLTDSQAVSGQTTDQESQYPSVSMNVDDQLAKISILASLVKYNDEEPTVQSKHISKNMTVIPLINGKIALTFHARSHWLTAQTQQQFTEEQENNGKKEYSYNYLSSHISKLVPANKKPKFHEATYKFEGSDENKHLVIEIPLAGQPTEVVHKITAAQ